MAQTRAPERETDEPLAMTWTIGRALTVVAILSMVLFWIWIFAKGPAKDNPDRLQDEAYVTQLEDRCQAMRDELAELPNAAYIGTPAERGAVLVDANLIVEQFIDDIEAGAPTSGDASKTMEGWIADWRIYLANREDYADRLQTDPNAQLLLDRSALGDSVDKTIQIFTQVNDIEACDTPGDVG